VFNIFEISLRFLLENNGQNPAYRLRHIIFQKELFQGVFVTNRNFTKTLILFIMFFSINISESAHGKENSTDEFIIGRIEFIAKNGNEFIVVLNSPEKAYLLNKGVLLLIKRGNGQVILKVNDTAGKYLRCEVDNETGTSIISYGEDVYYSDAINSGIKYRDAKRILAELIKLYEDFILKIESTEDPKIISSAVNNFSAGLDKLIPEMKRVNSKYPELEKFKISPPAELKNESALLEVLEPRLRDAFFKIKMFSSDEDVKKATEDLQKVLTKLKQDR
jgi:hypothetical protein